MYTQNDTPLFDALKKHIEDDVIPFHVPGHKHGRGLPEMAEYLGERVLQMDLNAMSDIDDLGNPNSVIKDAQQLAAEAFGADAAHFLINGTTSGIHAMMLAVLDPGDEIILPRNAHKSAFTGLIMSGATPVYTRCYMNPELQVVSNMSCGALKEAICKARKPGAVFIINPTYYGFAPDLKELTDIAHKYNLPVLADEAHGCHFYFSDKLPISGMSAGVDISAVSTHKTGGSFTQSSLLLVKGKLINNGELTASLNMLRSTSASYLLMSSIDVARKQLALFGKELIERSVELAEYARDRINAIPGLKACGYDVIKNDPGTSFFDPTKLVIDVSGLGISGFCLEKILRDDYHIQIELSDLTHVIAMITLGDNKEMVDAFVKALADIAKRPVACRHLELKHLPDLPEVVMTPREAFYSDKISVPINSAEGEISGEMLMAYPPGIPMITPGELITKEMIEYIHLLKGLECNLQGTADPEMNYIRVIKK